MYNLKVTQLWMNECLLLSVCWNQPAIYSRVKLSPTFNRSFPSASHPPSRISVNTRAAKCQIPSHWAEARQLSSPSNFRGNRLFSITRQGKHFKELALIFLHYCSNLLIIDNYQMCFITIWWSLQRNNQVCPCLHLFVYITCMGKGKVQLLLM